MTPLERQFELRKIGLNQKQLADILGVTPIAVSNVIRGHRVSARIMRAIAAAIGRDVTQVFPEYFQHTNKLTKHINQWKKRKKH